MGDRAQLQITDGKHSVFIYTHWGGASLATSLAKALAGGRSITDDPSYCVGHVLKRLAADAGLDGPTGLGFGFRFEDNDDERGVPLVLNIKDATVGFGNRRITVPDFIQTPDALGWS